MTRKAGKAVPIPLCYRPPASPAAPSPRIATLPAWVLGLVLASLTATAGVIVLVGGVLASLPAHLAHVACNNDAPAPSDLPSPHRGRGAGGEGAAPRQGDASLASCVGDNKSHGTTPLTPNPSPPEYRGIGEKVFPSPTRYNGAEKVSPFIPEDTSKVPCKEKPHSQPLPALYLPPVWEKVEPRKGDSLLQRVEIAKVENAQVHYSLRRLALPDAPPKALKLAISPVAHDDVGRILTKLGVGYRFTELLKQNLISVEILKKYDVVFLTCADLYVQDFHASGALRRYVESGGTLYASDLQCDLLLRAFPEFRAKRVILPGVPQSIDASVTDPGLQTLLGRKTIPLTFEAPDWRPAAFDPDKVTVCLQGNYRNQMGQDQSVPLLVKFRHERGTVIFTSFHHTKNDSVIVRKLLEYLVFSSVNARSEARISELMKRYEFAPSDLRPASISPKQPIEGVYLHKGGDLQVALGFEHAGAKLKLTLYSPKGQTVEHEDQGLYLIELPDAQPGRWRYTVTPIDVPHANFPLVIAVGAPNR